MSASTSTPGTNVNYLVSDSWTLQDALFTYILLRDRQG